MLDKIVVASLAASALTLGAPAAVADDPTYGCRLVTVPQGQGADVVMVAWVAHPSASVSIRCYIEVNGEDRGGGVYASGQDFAANAGTDGFTAEDTDVVQFCVDVRWDGGGVHTGSSNPCGPVERPQIPPQEVEDLLSSLGSATCSALTTVGVPAVVNAGSGITGISMDTDDCDVWVAGGRIVDFDPIGD